MIKYTKLKEKKKKKKKKNKGQVEAGGKETSSPGGMNDRFPGSLFHRAILTQGWKEGALIRSAGYILRFKSGAAEDNLELHFTNPDDCALMRSPYLFY